MEGENLVITATTARGQIKRTFSFSEEGMILVRNNNTRFETLNFHFSGNACLSKRCHLHKDF